MKPPKSPSKQTRPTPKQHATPQKQRRNLGTPQKQRRHHFPNDSGVELLTSEDQHPEAEEDENASPIVKRLFVDPTPQKNGRVLGLFDLLSPVKEQISFFERGPQESPSKPRTALLSLDSATISNINGVSLTTPRKRANAEGDQKSHLPLPDFAASPSKHSRTPQSAAKRYLLDTFVTPSKRRKLSEGAETPSNKAQGQALSEETPAFLRRDSQRFSFAELDDVPEEDEEDGDEDGFDTTTLSAKSINIPAGQNVSPTKSRLQRSFSSSSRISKFNLTGRVPLKRSSSKSLSSMIAAMRQTEDDRLDEEMELMRDMENDDDGYDIPARAQSPRRTSSRRVDDDEEQEIPADVLVEDSQFPDISAAELGPDGSHVVDTDSEPEIGGQPRKVWKKKGLKRQTKQVLMRPTVRKPVLPAQNREIEEDELVEESQDGPVTVVAPRERNGSKDDDAFASDYDDPDSELDVEASEDENTKVKSSVKPATKTGSKQATTSAAAASADQKENNNKSEAGAVTKATKKISATANANFCKLKIRSAKGAKGAQGIAFKKRFGKGRR